MYSLYTCVLHGAGCRPTSVCTVPCMLRSDTTSTVGCMPMSISIAIVHVCEDFVTFLHYPIGYKNWRTVLDYIANFTRCSNIM